MGRREVEHSGMADGPLSRRTAPHRRPRRGASDVREAPRTGRRLGRSGFTLIELMIVATILGALAGLALPNYQRVVERARVIKAVGDITVVQQALQEHFVANGTYPASLADVGWGAQLDPWGNPYEYHPVAGTPAGQLRKDRFLVPVNSDFDLWSMGPDGGSQPPFTAQTSRDDIVRANDGGYVGRAEDF